MNEQEEAYNPATPDGPTFGGHRIVRTADSRIAGWRHHGQKGNPRVGTHRREGFYLSSIELNELTIRSVRRRDLVVFEVEGQFAQVTRLESDRLLFAQSAALSLNRD